MRTHKVRAGDCLESIAEQYGFSSWRTIYDAPENADLKQRRPNPHLICPGDEVVIPERKTKTVSGRATQQRHRFKVRGRQGVFRIVMKDASGEPLTGYPFAFELEGETTVLEGTTDDTGLVEVPIPRGAESGELHFMGETVEVFLGHLDPVSRVSGIQQRLTNLGYACGPTDGALGPKTRKGLYDFQTDQEDLEASGEVDDATRERLQDLHDADTDRVSFEA